MLSETFLKIFAIATIISASAQAGPFEGRIVGGVNADIKDYPYQVSVINIDLHLCGGTIIRPNYVLSAAHCYVKIVPENLLVRAGSSYNYEGGQLVSVSSIIQHNQYNDVTRDFDISILKLSKSLVYGTGVQPITLPSQGQVIQGNPVATGWGLLYENGPVPAQLQKIVLPILPTDICKSAWQGRMTSNMLCAGWPENGKDTCEGDFGGPLALNGVLVGITSWGGTCGQALAPTVFTRVAAFRNYIDNIVGN